MANIGGGISSAQTSRPPVVLSRLDVFGHSYVDVNPGTASSNTATTNDYAFPHIFGTAIGLPKERLSNHGVGGAQLINNSRANGGFARILSEIVHPSSTFPSTRSGGAYLICFGINEVGNQTAANQSKVQADFDRCLVACISKMRASDVYLATNAAWTFGANFTTSAAAAADYTSGVQTSKEASVVDASGTSTATFTIPLGYHGEPICFNMVSLSGGSLIVTWGGTITGTTSIVGRTDTLSSLSINAQCAYPVRFTAAANGLSSANAGQTITVRITTVSASTFTLDGCWVEAFKPPPVVVCNVPRLPCRTYNIAFGDGVTTGVNTSFTSATAAFATATDAGQAITETDALGAFTAGKTISSVTNATTIVLSANAAAAKTSIQFTIARIINGYTNYSTNTNCSGATVASHSAADADVAALNTQITTSVAKFGSMVQIADLDTAMGLGDTVLPSNVYTWFNVGGLHPNDLGAARMATACWQAFTACRPENDGQNLGVLEIAGSTGNAPGADRRIIRDGQLYLPEFGSWGGTITNTAGDIYAMPIFFTESTLKWGATQIEVVTAATTTGNTVRVGIYDDVNFTGYPQNLRQEVSSVNPGTTAGIKNPGSFSSRVPQYGLYWLVFKVDAVVATAPVFRTIQGPNKYLPNWSTAGGALTPIAWKVTGQGTGALPTNFPTGGSLVSVAPAVGIVLTVQ